MSTIKNNNVEEILQKLKFHMKFDTWKEVAEYLGVSDGVISAWKKRNTQSAILLAGFPTLPPLLQLLKDTQRAVLPGYE